MNTCNCKVVNPERRSFLTQTVPACALACMGMQSGLALAQAGKGSSEHEAVHPFDEELDPALNYRRFMGMRHSGLIELGKGLKKNLGDEQAISLLKKISTDGWLRFARQQAAESPDGSFSNYIDTFRDKDRFKNTLVMEIVEDTPEAFELKVSECLVANTYLKENAGDIGFAWVCFGDYAWAEGFNPGIKLVRDKTLMQGHDCCNHRYLWTG